MNNTTITTTSTTDYVIIDSDVTNGTMALPTYATLMGTTNIKYTQLGHFEEDDDGRLIYVSTKGVRTKLTFTDDEVLKEIWKEDSK